MVKPLAVLCSDIHLSHRPPLFRSSEPDWYAAMARALKGIEDLALELDVPIICAGDVFDRWNSPPELINFAIANLPPMYAIPGQHDLPHHRIEMVHKSAYGTLVAAGIVTSLIEEVCDIGEHLRVFPYPWGMEHRPICAVEPGRTELVLVHAFCYPSQEYAYTGAPKEQHVNGYKELLAGHDAALFGDNHMGFVAKVAGCNVLNPGGLMIRKSSERARVPLVGVLYEGGAIEVFPLETRDDVYLDDDELAEKTALLAFDATHWIEELEGLDPEDLDFVGCLQQSLSRNDLPTGAKAVIRDLLDELGTK